MAVRLIFHEFESRYLQKRGGGPLTSEVSDRHVCKCYILQSPVLGDLETWKFMASLAKELGLP